ncbi:MAG TPA: GMC family oxidoreductase N-terminal domain-containing protein [Geminicoccus sp.]|jgi:choline dehydrogenase|uniref:GMC family oxidoreductase n=1 Tax=Geminicoccus sp. TaxID=2024832 RepID=UPI002E35F324|nr:GMC family oxidoreductase N-terminal domain-containing protein [Geminicoccus sp.]HEX2529154.1 GMC family oxidoreductase N-terminal domain-containing protein [Geminicoccus sp.]
MFDTIVVGAGSGGCVVAGRLSEDPGRKVLVLEAGRAAPLASKMPAMWISMVNTEVDWGYHTVPQPGCRMRRIFWPRGKMVGGSGALNAMIYIRGLPSDYDGWAALGATGWAWKDVLPVFKKSEHNERFGNDELHGSGGPLNIADVPYIDATEKLWMEACQNAGIPRCEDFNGVSQEGVGFFQLFCKNGERFGTAKAYLEPALERPNLTVETGVLTTRLIIENGRAIGVEYLKNGRPHTAHASSEVVLASGSIGSAQLLLLSGVGPADELKAVGVRVAHDLPGVGKDMQDHINIPTTFHTKDAVGIGGMTGEEIRAAIDEWTQKRTGAITSNWAAAGGHVRSRPEVLEPDLQFYGVIAANRDHARYLSSRPGITLHATLQRPNSRGELTLRSADPLEHPNLDPRYFVSDPTGTDVTTLAEGVKLSRRIAAASPLADIIDCEITPSAEARTDAELADYVRGHCTTLYHPACTCRMGTDEMAVTTPELKVRGIEGLRVADASVFPKMVSGNTNAPTIMVAERCAEFIRQG